MKIGEIVIGVIILGILGVFLNATHLLMPDSLNMMLILGLIVGFLALVGLVWREQASDEREMVHIHKSGRWSFFAGAAVLVAGIGFQAAKHDVDPWLIYGLAIMVLTKLVSRVVHHFRN